MAATDFEMCFGNDMSAAMPFHPRDPNSHTGNTTHALAPPRPTSTLEISDFLAGQEPLSAEELDTLTAEYVPHVPGLDTQAYARIVRSVRALLPHNDREAMAAVFPCLRHLDVYLQLYFEHFHPRMPFLHKPTFQASRENWQLVIAIAAIGCHYSKADLKARHMAHFYHIAQHVVQKKIGDLGDMDPLADLQSLLLFQLNGQYFHGGRTLILQLQFYRNILPTLCRQLLSQDGHILSHRRHQSTTTNPWLQWVRKESRRRIIYFTWISECLQAIILMLPPLLSLHELQTPLPSSEAHWGADGEQWQCLPAPQPAPPICAVLVRITHDPSAQDDLGPSAKLALMLSAYVQHNAAQDLKRAMMSPVGEFHASDQLHLDPAVNFARTALKALAQFPSRHPMGPGDAATIFTDCGIAARLLLILSFAPPRLLYPFSRWQTSEEGFQRARHELQDILTHNLQEARHCLYLAAQLFQYFRTAGSLCHIDAFVLLLSALYILAYIDVVISLRDVHGDKVGDGNVVRVDQPLGEEERRVWLERGQHQRPHIAGIGLLDVGRSSARLYKETARIMAQSAPSSRLAGVLSELLMSQSTRDSPEFQHFEELQV